MTLTPRALRGALLTAATALCAAALVALLVWIVADAAVGGAPALSWRFLTQPPSDELTRGGIFPALCGTAAVTLLMTIAVMPVGVVTAIWLSEYAPPRSRLKAVVRTAVQNLAGVPSIVFGLFGLGFFVHFVGRHVDRLMGVDLKYAQPGLLWAALTLAVLTLPVVIVATEEALRSVPPELREASLALGATRSQTVARVVLPRAAPGILTAAVLAISRGAGEVAPILLTGVAFWLPELPRSPSEQFMHLGYHAYVLATQSPDVQATRPLLYATVLVLLVVTFGLDLVAMVIRARMGRRR